MSHDVLVVHDDCCGIGSEVHQYAASLFLWSQYGICQCERSQIHFGDVYACYVEASVEVLVVTLALEDVEVVALQTRAENAYCVDGEL